MKKYYQYLGVALIMVFSFYYTDKISGIVLNKNPLMVSINQKSLDYEVTCVNAKINGDYITPGINGLKVNTKESFYKMKAYDVFNHYFLVYDQVKPDVSLEDNKDKIIQEGNSKLKQVSFILESEGTISDYFKQQNILASLLTTVASYQKNSYFEQINNEINGFQSLENSLNLNQENKHLCVLNDNNKNICLKNKNYLIKPKLELVQNNLIEVKNNLKNGSIIYIRNSANLKDVIYLLKEIQYKGLEIVLLSDLISETNNYH